MVELEYITREELLKDCIKDVKRIAESQFVEIDDDYFLIIDGEKYAPMTMIQGNEIITITFIYNLKSLPKLEFTISKTRFIVKNGAYVKFNKVIINSI
jgi:hypothetical protein